MKTSNLKIRKVKYGFSILSLAFVSVFFLASCSKDELPQPSAGNTAVANVEMKQIAPPIVYAFTVIAIDHQAGRNRLPDYRVTVKSDGTVLFEGRRNVVVRGKVSFTIGAGRLSELIAVFKNGGFMKMKDQLDLNPELPRVATSFSAVDVDGANSAKMKTLVDNNKLPAALVRMREKAELILHTERFVTGDDWPDPAHQNF